MKDEVRSDFPKFSEYFEGRVLHMYLDILGKVTTGVGCLIDSPGAAALLPWKHPDGSLASADAVHTEWYLVKAHPELKRLHWRFAQPYAKLRLSEADVDALTLTRLDMFEGILKHYFPDFEAWVAEAQLATLSMGWAMGPAFPPRWPGFSKCCRAQNWASYTEGKTGRVLSGGAAFCCKMRERGADGVFNAGLVPRNQKNRLLFIAAGEVSPVELEAPSTLPDPIDDLRRAVEISQFDRFDLIHDSDRSRDDDEEPSTRLV